MSIITTSFITRSLVISTLLCAALTAHSKVIAHWNFDSPAQSGGYLDASGNGHTLNQVTPPLHITNGQRFGQGALNFDGQAQHSLLLKGTTQGGALGLENRSFTISFWVTRKSLSEQWLFAQGDPNELSKHMSNQILHVGFRPAKSRIYSKNSMSLAFYGNDLDHAETPIDTSEWHHYVLSFDAETKEQRIVIDGQTENAYTAQSDSNFIGGGSNPLTIGHRYGGGDYFNGLMDELWVFDTVLTDEEIRNLYENNLPGVKVDIPEPQAYSLLLGLVGLAACMQRRSRHHRS